MATKKKAIRKAAAKSESKRKAAGTKKAGSGKAASRAASTKSTVRARATREGASASAKPKRAPKKRVTTTRSAGTATTRAGTSKTGVKAKRAETAVAKRRVPKAREAAAATGVSPRLTFPVVGIGASAGGLQAFEELFGGLPADSGMAFVLVSHLDPHHASILHELLRKSATMPVNQVTDGVFVEPNQVYVAPPGKDLAILNGALQLMDPPRVPWGAACQSTTGSVRWPRTRKRKLSASFSRVTDQTARLGSRRSRANPAW